MGGSGWLGIGRAMPLGVKRGVVSHHTPQQPPQPHDAGAVAAMVLASTEPLCMSPGSLPQAHL